MTQKSSSDNPNDSTNSAPVSAPQADTGSQSTLTADQQKIKSAIDKSNAGEPTQGRTPPASRLVRPNRAQTPPDLDIEFDAADDPDVTPDKVAPQQTTKDTTQEKGKVVKEAAGKKDFAEEPISAKTFQPNTQTATQQQGTQQGAGQKATPFDYTGFTPEETTLLKQMSNQAREYTAKVIKQNKEFQQTKGIPDSYYQHPEAYVLTPEFRDTTANIHYANVEREHWKQQLINVRSGREWHGLQGFDQQGNPVLSGPFKASDEAEVDIANALQTVTAQGQQFISKREEIQRGWSQRVQQDAGLIQQERAKRFAWVADDKQMDETVELPNVGPVPIRKIHNEFKALFPGYHHGNPVLDLAADMFVALQIYGSKIRELQNNLQSEQKMKQDVIRMEPSPDTVKSSASPTGGAVEFDIEGMPS